MKKLVLAAIICLFPMQLAFSQTVSVSYPYVNPFGEVNSHAPNVSVAYGSSIHGNWSFFGVVGSSVETQTQTITYMSVSRHVSLSNSFSADIQLADFRSFSPNSGLHWINVTVECGIEFGWGTVGAISDTYLPVNGGPVMALNGVTYVLQGFGPADRFSIETRLAKVNYAGWQIDTTISYNIDDIEFFIRGVYGYDSNVSSGISVSF